ncbi:hypothetical protein SU45_06510 [Brachyspira hyodysenteriae]|uniref:hypothetical protein n=2 Tax=Brachyspira hyodysenteriae TaxID=159 RepID=UPI00063DB079|nr:hypothetical protein [Brachyspira hyodysenteriae]KLI17008.1 hypothetical protein SU45_06510 [Brachyspira hyodysenteriae]
MSEVYSIGIDLSQLQKALQMSLQIKNNLGPLGSGGGSQGGSNNKMLKNSNAFNKSIQQQNQNLKTQNKLLNGNLQKLNLMRLAASKIKMGALGLGGLAAGGIAGLLGGAVNGYKGTLSTQLRAKNVGLDIREHDALAYAGKMTGLGEDSLISSIEGLTTSLQDYSKWGNFASLGLNASDLQSKNPVEALFEVLDSMKDSDLPQYLKKQIIDDIGIPFDNFRFVLKEGTGEIEKFFKEGFKLNTYTEKDKTTGEDKDITGKVNSGLIKGERAGITFAENFAGVMKKISFDIAPDYIKGLETATPLLNKFGEVLSKGITSVIDFFTAFASAEDKGAFLKEKGGELLTSAGGALKGVWDGVTDYLKGKWDEVVQFFKDKWDEGVKSITGKFQEIGFNLSIGFNNALANIPVIGGSKYETTTMGTFKDGIEYTKRGEIFDPLKHTEEDRRKINDGVITKDGKVIETNPKDYIFAMKQPQQLAGAGSSISGNNYTITINNPVVRNDGDIRKLKSQLEQLIKSFNSKR